ncbi:hypothetical protein ERJ75_001148100 [Trypanosoma vivax]|nr:hypothetical protein ERJ75_001148100 [Trypanosoma vivax]
MRRGLREVKGQRGQVESTAQVLLLEATRTRDSRQEERAAPAPLFREVKGLGVDTECDLVGRESQRTGHLGSRDASDTKEGGLRVGPWRGSGAGGEQGQTDAAGQRERTTAGEQRSKEGENGEWFVARTGWEHRNGWRRDRWENRRAGCGRGVTFGEEVSGTLAVGERRGRVGVNGNA